MKYLKIIILVSVLQLGILDPKAIDVLEPQFDHIIQTYKNFVMYIN